MDILTILESILCFLGVIINTFVSAFFLCIGICEIKWFKKFLKGFFLILVGVFFYFLSVNLGNKIFEILGFDNVIVSVYIRSV